MFVLGALFCGCRERGYAKLCENPYLPPGWFAGVLYVLFHSMSLFLFGITLLWLYFILSLSLSDARCIGLIVSNGRIPGVEQTERLLPQGDIRTMGISPITFFRGSNVFRQEIGWLNLCVYLFPLVFLMIDRLGRQCQVLAASWKLRHQGNCNSRGQQRRASNSLQCAKSASCFECQAYIPTARCLSPVQYGIQYTTIATNLGQIQATYVHTYTGKPVVLPFARFCGFSARTRFLFSCFLKTFFLLVC